MIWIFTLVVVTAVALLVRSANTPEARRARAVRQRSAQAERNQIEEKAILVANWSHDPVVKHLCAEMGLVFQHDERKTGRE